MENDRTKTNTFTDEGRLPQVEFAIKNVSKAGTIVGYACVDGVILVGVNREATNGRIEKIYKLNDNVYCALCGLFGDAMRLKKYAQIRAQEILEEFGVECPLLTLCRIIGQKKQSFTQYAGTRPFGTSFLYSGVVDGRYVLLSTDPSGTLNQWRGMCYGENEDAINNGMKNDFPEGDMSMETATREILRLIGKTRESGAKEADRIEILHFTRENKRFLSRDEILGILNEVDARA